LSQAKEAADRNDWEESRQFAEDILAVDPSNKDAQAYIVSELQLKIGRLLAQALTAADHEDWDESIRFAQMALSMDPDNATAQTYLIDAIQSNVEHILDRVEEAADLRHWEGVRLLTEEILAIDPGNGDAETYRDAAHRELAKSGPAKELSDERQKNHYEIAVDPVSGVATIRGDKFTTDPNDEFPTIASDEFMILAALYRNRGRYVNQEQIRVECGEIFGSTIQGNAYHSIKRCISSLRQKIEEDPSNPEIIGDFTAPGGVAYVLASIVEHTTIDFDTKGALLSGVPNGTSGPEAPLPLSGPVEEAPTEADTALLEDDFEEKIQTQMASLTLEEDSQQVDQVMLSTPGENESIDGDLATSENVTDEDILDQTSSLTQGEAGEQVGPIVWAAIRNDLGYGIPWVSDQEDVSADLPTVRLGWEVANAVAVGISEYLQTNFNVVEDPDEWFHLIYEDVEIEVESWDGTTAEVVALASEYFAPWYKALEDIVETAIPNIAKGVVDSLEVTEIQVDKMLETIYAASEHFTHKWIDNSVDSIVEAGLGKVEGLVRDFLGDESDDIDVEQAGTDARTEIQPDVMQAVSWFISDARSTLSPKLGDSYDTVSDELLTALESIGPIAKKSISIEPPDTSWGDDILSSVFDTTSS
jgi:tetratricopeptide (TPR) repeat protein